MPNITLHQLVEKLFLSLSGRALGKIFMTWKEALEIIAFINGKKN